MRNPVADFDLAVIGSGAAGMMAAVTASSDLRVVLLTDRGLGTSNSAVAQGGLQFPLPGEQAHERFKADMRASGGPNVDEVRLDHFVRSVRNVVLLLESWGLELDRESDGNLARLSAGGLSEPRIVTSGARIGPSILKVLRARIQQSSVQVRTQASVEAIRPVDAAHFEIVAADQACTARSVVVATGGRSFERAREVGIETSNPTNSNGSMRHILLGLGLVEREADEFQLHPYGIVDETGVATGKCVPESIVSMGAFVADRTGRQIVEPTADRAAVAAAMRSCLDTGRGVERGGAFACRLVMAGVDEEELAARYPHIGRQLRESRLDSGDIPVRPVVHYQLGGFEVGPDGSTPIRGLFLAGELTGGLHGRNRLMGNGITEAVVDGWSAGRAVNSLLSASAVSSTR